MNLTKFEKIAGWVILLPMYFFFGPLLFSVLFSVLLRLFHISLNAVAVNSWYNLFYDTGMLLIAIFIFRRFLIEEWKKLKGHWLKTILWSITVGFVIIYATNIVSGIMVQIFEPGSSSANQNALIMMLDIEPLPILLASVVVAPLLEELVFRVAIFKGIYPHSRFLAYLASGGIFGLVHVLDGLMAGDLSQLAYLLPYGLLGMVFCWLYEKKGTLAVPILVHMSNNFVSMLLTMLF